MDYDIFNGDADGILSLVQWRLAYPNQSELITGVKRDINLMERVPLDKVTKSSNILVFDISLEKNVTALNKVLELDANVVYIDHHRPGSIPNKPNLSAHIDVSADTCTALIVDNILDKKFHTWAIAAAYGDNLITVADDLAQKAGLNSEQARLLNELGMLINYNGYGAVTEDLVYHPAELFKILVEQPDPFEIINQPDSPYHKLKAVYESDFEKAKSADVIHQSQACFVVLLKDQAWSRRISGTFGNHLANENPNRAHIVVTEIDNDNFLVSLRAPLSKRFGAGDICSQFETGGGRAGAGGINRLARSQLNRFIKVVESFYTDN